jgi:predicted NBD/HSP70 family sugar kinase
LELFPSCSSSLDESIASQTDSTQSSVFEEEADNDPRSWSPEQVADWLEGASARLCSDWNSGKIVGVAAPVSLDAESKAKLATKNGTWLVAANQAELKALGKTLPVLGQTAVDAG